MLDIANQLELHKLLLAGDPTASAAIAEALFQPLLEKLRREHRRVDPDLLTEAAIEALMGYLKGPERFNPEKRSLFGYLVMAATGDLRNTLHEIKRLSKREVSGGFTGVELDRLSRNKEKEEGEGPVSRLIAESMARKVDELFSDTTDRHLAQLVIARERKTEPYARLLGLEGLPLEMQRREVKRHKDRIKKRLERYGQVTAKR